MRPAGREHELDEEGSQCERNQHDYHAEDGEAATRPARGRWVDQLPLGVDGRRNACLYQTRKRRDECDEEDEDPETGHTGLIVEAPTAEKPNAETQAQQAQRTRRYGGLRDR